MAGDGFAQAFQQSLQVRHTFPEFPNLVAEFSTFSGRFAKLGANGTGLGQNDASEDEEATTDRKGRQS